MDDLLILTNSSHKNYLEKVDIILKYSRDMGLKVYAKKWKFATQKLEYFRYLIGHESIEPSSKKTSTILNILSSKTVKEL